MASATNWLFSSWLCFEAEHVAGVARDGGGSASEIGGAEGAHVFPLTQAADFDVQTRSTPSCRVAHSADRRPRIEACPRSRADAPEVAHENQVRLFARAFEHAMLGDD